MKTKERIEEKEVFHFKTLMKRQLRMMSPRTVRILDNGVIIISRDLRKLFLEEDKPFIEVLVDEDYNRLAFKPSSDEIRGYRLSDSGTFSCGPIKKVKGVIGVFEARLTEGKIIIDKIDVSELKGREFWDD